MSCMSKISVQTICNLENQGYTTRYKTRLNPPGNVSGSGLFVIQNTNSTLLKIFSPVLFSKTS